MQTCLNSKILLIMLLRRKTFLDLSGVGDVMLLNHHHTCEGEKNCTRVIQDFKGEISCSTTSKPNTHCQAQDPKVSYQSFQYQLAFLGENKSLNSCVASWLPQCKTFIEKIKISSRNNSSPNYLFLLDSITWIRLNYGRTFQRTKQTSSLLKS
jgi:hypothetical protein